MVLHVPMIACMFKSNRIICLIQPCLCATLPYLLSHTLPPGCWDCHPAALYTHKHTFKYKHTRALTHTHTCRHTRTASLLPQLTGDKKFKGNCLRRRWLGSKQVVKNTCADIGGYLKVCHLHKLLQVLTKMEIEPWLLAPQKETHWALHKRNWALHTRIWDATRAPHAHAGWGLNRGADLVFHLLVLHFHLVLK